MFLILKLDFPKNCPKFNIMHSTLKRLSYFGGFSQWKDLSLIIVFEKLKQERGKLKEILFLIYQNTQNFLLQN